MGYQIKMERRRKMESIQSETEYVVCLGIFFNPFALNLGIHEFGEKWREYHQIPEDYGIFAFEELYDDFRINDPITFDDYMKQIHGEL
jgi:hypothetical protein